MAARALAMVVAPALAALEDQEDGAIQALEAQAPEATESREDSELLGPEFGSS